MVRGAWLWRVLALVFQDGGMVLFIRWRAGCRAPRHFQMKTLKHVGTEMVLHVLAYNMKRVMKILGVGGLMEAIHA
jgi:hypothetical protein